MRSVRRRRLFRLDRFGNRLLDLKDQSGDLGRGLGCALGQLAYLVGDDGKTTSLLTGPGCLNGCVQGQQIGLEGDFVNGSDYL